MFILRMTVNNLGLQDITTTLDILLVEFSFHIPGLAGLLIAVDVALHELLASVGFLLGGVLLLVGGLSVILILQRMKPMVNNSDVDSVTLLVSWAPSGSVLCSGSSDCELWLILDAATNALLRRLANLNFPRL